ncbi:MAG: 2-dehydropantoate 2-reductase [bacterium]|jgi:2-dehydropantoate 2-reductase
MTIAVIGAGGMGGLFGGLLWMAGEGVVLIDRGEHLKAIQSQGLTLKTAGPRAFVVDVPATDDPEGIGRVDLLIFCVKTYDLETAAAAAAPLVGPESVVLPVQNGIAAPDRLGEVLGAEKVIGGVSYHQGAIEAPGVISYGGVEGKLYLGELGGGGSGRVERVRRLLCDAGIDSEIHPDIRLAMWEKLVLICATGGVMAYYRRPIGPLLEDMEARSLLLGVMKEAELVARARGIALPEGTAERHLAFIEKRFTPDTRSSQLEDILAGRRLEVESLNGEVVRLGRKLGVETPLNRKVYDALKPYAAGSGSSAE